MTNYKEMTTKQLKEIAKEKKVKNWWNLKKEELITEIQQLETPEVELPEVTAMEYRLMSEIPNDNFYDEELDSVLWTDIFLDETCSIDNKKARRVLSSLSKKGLLDVYSIKDKEPSMGITKSTISFTELGKAWMRKLFNGQIAKPKEKPEEKNGAKRRGGLIEYNGKAQNICAWGKELGLSANTLYHRIYYKHMSVEEAFELPVRQHRAQA